MLPINMLIRFKKKKRSLVTTFEKYFSCMKLLERTLHIFFMIFIINFHSYKFTFPTECFKDSSF